MITDNHTHVLVVIAQDNYDILGTLKYDETDITRPAFIQVKEWMDKSYPLLKHYYYVIRDLVE